MFDLETDPEQAAANRSYDDASDLTFNGKALNDFSVTRQRAAVALGLRWKTGRLSPADLRHIFNPEFQAREEASEELAALNRKRRPSKRDRARADDLTAFIAERKDAPEKMPDYTGIEEDAAIVVYAMSLPDSECHKIRRQSSADALARFDRWCEANSLGLGGENTGEAKAIFFAVATALAATESRPVIKGGEGDDSPNG